MSGEDDLNKTADRAIDLILDGIFDRLFDQLSGGVLIDDLNDLCEEFGCEPGASRLEWLRGQLEIAKRHNEAMPIPDDGLDAEDEADEVIREVRWAIEAAYPVKKAIARYVMASKAKQREANVRHDARVTELLEANNRYLQEARDARATLALSRRATPIENL